MHEVILAVVVLVAHALAGDVDGHCRVGVLGIGLGSAEAVGLVVRTHLGKPQMGLIGGRLCHHGVGRAIRPSAPDKFVLHPGNIRTTFEERFAYFVERQRRPNTYPLSYCSRENLAYWE